MDKISPCLWYANEAEEAARLYTSLFDDGEVLDVMRHEGVSPGEPGTVLLVTFRIGGRTYTALNGAPDAVRFTDAFSLQVVCEDQAEVDRLWEALLAGGGEENMCAWLRDRYGVAWQIVPKRLLELHGHPDTGVRSRVMASMMSMVKIDVAEIERAAAG